MIGNIFMASFYPHGYDYYGQPPIAKTVFLF